MQMHHCPGACLYFPQPAAARTTARGPVPAAHMLEHTCSSLWRGRACLQTKSSSGLTDDARHALFLGWEHVFTFISRRNHVRLPAAEFLALRQTEKQQPASKRGLCLRRCHTRSSVINLVILSSMRPFQFLLVMSARRRCENILKYWIKRGAHALHGTCTSSLSQSTCLTGMRVTWNLKDAHQRWAAAAAALLPVPRTSQPSGMFSRARRRASAREQRGRRG